MEQLNLTAEQINFQVLNFLNSVLQGKFAYLNVLQQLEHPLSSTAEIDQTKAQLKKINSFSKLLNDGQPIIKKTNPQNSPEEQFIFNLLVHLKNELLTTSAHIRQLDLGSEWQNQPGIYKQLVAYFSWSAYQDENFFKKLQTYHQSNNNKIYFSELSDEVKEAGNHVKLSSNFLKSIRAPGGPDANFAPHLAFCIKALPFHFMSWAHDANQLLNIKMEQFTFDIAEFTAEQAEEWRQGNFEAIESGYWRAFGFTVPEAIEWKTTGFLSPRKAINWKVSGFPARTALAWFALGYSPLLAIQWANLNIPPEAAAILISHGYTVPAMVPNDPEKIKSLLAEGVKK